MLITYNKDELLARLFNVILDIEIDNIKEHDIESKKLEKAQKLFNLLEKSHYALSDMVHYDFNKNIEKYKSLMPDGYYIDANKSIRFRSRMMTDTSIDIKYLDEYYVILRSDGWYRHLRLSDSCDDLRKLIKDIKLYDAKIYQLDTNDTKISSIFRLINEYESRNKG